MNKPTTSLLLLSLLICKSVLASELSSADEKNLIHESNVALSQQNYSEAFGKYQKLAEQGNAVAQFNLGVLYLNGQGIPKDEKRAFSWFGKSAAQGYSRALQELKKGDAQGNTYAQSELTQLQNQATVAQNSSPRIQVAKSTDAFVPDTHDAPISAAKPDDNKDSDSNKDEKTASVSFGFDNTAGNYGTKHESTSTSIPTIISYGTDNYQTALTVPYLEQTGPAGSLAGARRLLAAGSNKIVSTKGWGDVLGSATFYLIDNENTGISLDVKTEVKFGTASVSKGLGTGKNDYSIEIDVYKDFDKLGLSGGLGYTKLGSPGNVVVNGIQENIVLHNVFNASLGSTYQITKATNVGVSLSATQPSENGTPRQEDITLDFNRKINRNNKLDVYLLKGLSNGSPDRGFGASIKSFF